MLAGRFAVSGSELSDYGQAANWQSAWLRLTLEPSGHCFASAVQTFASSGLEASPPSLGQAANSQFGPVRPTALPSEQTIASAVQTVWPSRVCTSPPMSSELLSQSLPSRQAVSSCGGCTWSAGEDGLVTGADEPAHPKASTAKANEVSIGFILSKRPTAIQLTQGSHKGRFNHRVTAVHRLRLHSTLQSTSHDTGWAPPRLSESFLGMVLSNLAANEPNYKDFVLTSDRS
jgi:hypothetical protein